MSDPWLALEFGVDPAERIAQVGAAHEAFLNAGQDPRRVRAVVANSWRRSAGALLDPETTAPIEMTTTRWRATARATRWPGCCHSSGTCSAASPRTAHT